MSSEISEGLGLGTPSPSEISEGNFVLKCYAHLSPAHVLLQLRLQLVAHVVFLLPFSDKTVFEENKRVSIFFAFALHFTHSWHKFLILLLSCNSAIFIPCIGMYAGAFSHPF